MSDVFQIPVEFKGRELLFTAELIKQGYIHTIRVDVNGVTVTLEPDEERSYRALIDPTAAGSDKVDIDLLKAIVDTLERVKL